MENASERRAERRLYYRWPVRFAGGTKQKPFPGQMVDVSSNGMAMLCRADRSCPQSGQSITASFGVPHFDSGNSFDAVFFNRTGRVCRVDELSSKVHRLAIQFAEPLFFRPGEQNISESDAQQRLKAKALSIVEAQEKARVYGEALARTEERTRFYAQAKAEAEEKLKAEIEARCRAEARSKVEAEEKIRAYAEAAARAEERAKSESQARLKAEAKAKSEAKLRAKAHKQAKAEAQKRAKFETEARETINTYENQIAQIKDEAARQIARVKAEAADTAVKAKTGLKAKAGSKTSHKSKTPAQKKAKAKHNAKQPAKDGLLKKVDKFVTDKNKIF